MNYKTCNTCNISKQETSFPDKGLKYKKRSNKCYACKSKVKRLNNKDYERSKKLKKIYNLSIEDYDLMYNNQKGLCKICNKPEYHKLKNGNVKPLAVDHCHETNKIRGLLCSNCNTGLGMFRDNIEYLKSAIWYLQLSNTDKN